MFYLNGRTVFRDIQGKNKSLYSCSLSLSAIKRENGWYCTGCFEKEWEHKLKTGPTNALPRFMRELIWFNMV